MPLNRAFKIWQCKPFGGRDEGIRYYLVTRVTISKAFNLPKGSRYYKLHNIVEQQQRMMCGRFDRILHAFATKARRTIRSSEILTSINTSEIHFTYASCGWLALISAPVQYNLSKLLYVWSPSKAHSLRPFLTLPEYILLNSRLLFPISATKRQALLCVREI